jgi:hypothetical protein
VDGGGSSSSYCVDRYALVRVPNACCTYNTFVLGFLVLHGASIGARGGVAEMCPGVGVADAHPGVGVAIHSCYCDPSHSLWFPLLYLRPGSQQGSPFKSYESRHLTRVWLVLTTSRMYVCMYVYSIMAVHP